MLWRNDHGNRLQGETDGARRVAMAVLGLLSGAFLTLAAPAAMAQPAASKADAAKSTAKSDTTKSSAAKSDTAKTAAAQAPGTSTTSEPEAAWVKLCEKNAQTDNKQICLTHHERIDGNSGMVLVAAAIRSVEGEKQQTLLVRLPTAIALAIPAGVQIRVDDNKPVMLQYTLCYATSCQAETQMTPDLMNEFRNGKQLVVAAVNLERKAIGFPVPLEGFAKAYDGPPVDTAKYQAARAKLMEMIRRRQLELAQKAEEAEKKKQQGQDTASAGSSATDAPATTKSSAPQPKTAVPVQ
jgi:invasion protein IalB